LLTEADIGESYDIDPVLQEDCGNVVESVCSHVKPGEGRLGTALRVQKTTINLLFNISVKKQIILMIFDCKNP